MSLLLLLLHNRLLLPADETSVDFYCALPFGEGYGVQGCKALIALSVAVEAVSVCQTLELVSLGYD